jgi:hypothetical protein
VPFGRLAKRYISTALSFRPSRRRKQYEKPEVSGAKAGAKAYMPTESSEPARHMQGGLPLEKGRLKRYFVVMACFNSATGKSRINS